LDGGKKYGHNNAKVTYSLKPETVLRIEELAAQWGIPKSEVVRRAIEGVDPLQAPKPKMTPLEALDWLQKNGISQAEAKKFNAENRRIRQASSAKRR
jgi:hypothetical protein